jgi:hypothetical protein
MRHAVSVTVLLLACVGILLGAATAHGRLGSSHTRRSELPRCADLAPDHNPALRGHPACLVSLHHHPRFFPSERPGGRLDARHQEPVPTSAG